MKKFFVSLLPLTAVLVLICAVSPQALAQGDVESGRQLGYTCLGCHGIPGYRNAYPSYRVPKLGGQKGDYVNAALRAYRAGTREHPTMQAQGNSLSDQDIEDLVAWLGEIPPAADEVTAETDGLPEAARTCVTCHGTAGKAVAPAPPVLSGQHPSYLQQALDQYRQTKRGNTVMNSFAAGLEPADIEQIAAFFASREGLSALQHD